MSEFPATQLEGGSVKIVDSSIFNVSVTTAVAEVTVNPGAMRELHVSVYLNFLKMEPGYSTGVLVASHGGRVVILYVSAPGPAVP
jgi:oxalate decarboxylase/phosphoglucose isomerase-like protein (cupin superfamily)